MIKQTITKIVLWLARLVGYKPRFKTEVQADLPDDCAENTLYLIGEDGHYWMAALVSPCGCGEIIQLALDPTGRPRWSVTFNNRMQVTLKPLVHRKVNCKSHFLFQKGRIIWC